MKKGSDFDRQLPMVDWGSVENRNSRHGDAGTQHLLGDVLRLLGYQSARKGSLEQAVGYWRESLHFRPDDAVLHKDLGALLARLGRTREAVPEFEAALRLNPKLEPARRNLETARGQMEKLRPK